MVTVTLALSSPSLAATVTVWLSSASKSRLAPVATCICPDSRTMLKLASPLMLYSSVSPASSSLAVTGIPTFAPSEASSAIVRVAVGLSKLGARLGCGLARATMSRSPEMIPSTRPWLSWGTLKVA